MTSDNLPHTYTSDECEAIVVQASQEAHAQGVSEGEARAVCAARDRILRLRDAIKGRGEAALCAKQYLSDAARAIEELPLGDKADVTP